MSGKPIRVPVFTNPPASNSESLISSSSVEYVNTPVGTIAPAFEYVEGLGFNAGYGTINFEENGKFGIKLLIVDDDNTYGSAMNFSMDLGSGSRVAEAEGNGRIVLDGFVATTTTESLYINNHGYASNYSYYITITRLDSEFGHFTDVLLPGQQDDLIFGGPLSLIEEKNRIVSINPIQFADKVADTVRATIDNVFPGLKFKDGLEARVTEISKAEAEKVGKQVGAEVEDELTMATGEREHLAALVMKMAGQIRALEQKLDDLTTY